MNTDVRFRAPFKGGIWFLCPPCKVQNPLKPVGMCTGALVHWCTGALLGSRMHWLVVVEEAVHFIVVD